MGFDAVFPALRALPFDVTGNFPCVGFGVGLSGRHRPAHTRPGLALTLEPSLEIPQKAEQRTEILAVEKETEDKSLLG